MYTNDTAAIQELLDAAVNQINVLTEDLEDLTKSLPPKSRMDYTTKVNQPIVMVPVRVTNFLPGLPPIGFSYSDGVFTCEESGVYFVSLERIYENVDSNPNLLVVLTIEVRVNGVPAFTKSSPISSATANDEPGILPFTSPGHFPLTAGDTVEVWVSGEDGGLDPEGVDLIRCKVVAHAIAPPII